MISHYVINRYISRNFLLLIIDDLLRDAIARHYFCFLFAIQKSQLTIAISACVCVCLQIYAIFAVFFLTLAKLKIAVF